MNKKSLGVAFSVLFFMITTAFIAASFSGSKDIRSRAATGVYPIATPTRGVKVTPTRPPLMPTPKVSSTPKPTQLTFTTINTSGTCTDKCHANYGTCISVGTDASGTNGIIMTYSNANYCYLRTNGNCGSPVVKLRDAGTLKCSGNSPEWTNCKCKKNPFIN